MGVWRRTSLPAPWFESVKDEGADMAQPIHLTLSQPLYHLAVADPAFVRLNSDLQEGGVPTFLFYSTDRISWSLAKSASNKISKSIFPLFY